VLAAERHSGNQIFAHRQSADDDGVETNLSDFLDFTKGHWLSMFRNRFPTGAPPLEMRVMTKERRVGVELADDVPNYSGHSGKLC